MHLERDPAQSAATRTSHRGKKIGLLIGMGLSVLLLVYVFSGLEWGTLFENLGRLRVQYLPVVVVLTVLVYYVRALRWGYLLPAEQGVSTRLLFDATTIGMFANSILPLRAGEIIRPWIIQRFSVVGFSSALASIVTERLFDVLGLLACMAIVLGSLSDVPPVIALGAKALGALCLVLLVVLFFAYLAKAQLLKALDLCAKSLLPSRIALRISALGRDFIEGITGIRSRRDLLMTLFYTAVIWALIGVYHLSGFWLLGEYPAYSVGLLTALVIGLVVAAPSGPGFVGTYQFGCVLAISTICRYPKEFALAYSIVLHIFQTLLLCGIGLWLLHRRGLMFRDLTEEHSRTE